MPLPDLLLGTRRLRRDVGVQAQLLERDVAQLKFATAQMRHIAVERITSPLGLLSAAGIGFLAGHVSNRPSKPKPEHSQHETETHHHKYEDAVTYALHTARSMGLQILLPIAAGWLQSKFGHQHGEDNPPHEPASADPQ